MAGITDGKKMKDCNDCGGSGEEGCSYCGGSGVCDCETFEGTGEVGDDDEDEIEDQIIRSEIRAETFR